ncbi:MAG: cytidylate kinase-like family protein [Clostridia bacterium]|nr:cytidylate kinase-like family protein [Clostridia bacterium]
MQLITISREFGSGGRELGKRLADILGWDYYDREIILSIAQQKGMDEKYVEDALQGGGWKNIPLTFRRSLSASSVNGNAVELLLAQKQIVEAIAARGRNAVIVGRNADVLLAEHNPLRLFVCAEESAKLQRCLDRATAGENLTEKELLRQMRRIDKSRAKTRELLSASSWGQRDAYELTVNTTGWQIKELAPVIAVYAEKWFGREQ